MNRNYFAVFITMSLIFIFTVLTSISQPDPDFLSHTTTASAFLGSII